MLNRLAAVARVYRRATDGFIHKQLLLCALLLAGHAEVSAFNKCVVDGKTVYQDAACAPETIDQAFQAKSSREELHRELDLLQAKGVGMVGQRPTKSEPEPKENSDGTEDGRFVGMSRSAFRAKQEQQFQDMAKNTEKRNAESATKLTNILDEAKQACGGKLSKYPEVGMSDAYFRKCTMHARFGGITQVVVSQKGVIPLRLYVFGHAKEAQRVYSIDGVITAVKP